MGRKKKHPEHVNHERWLVSYADFITLLFAFFVVMFASSQVDDRKIGKMARAMQLAFQEMGVFGAMGHTVPMADDGSVPDTVQMIDPFEKTTRLHMLVPGIPHAVDPEEEVRGVRHRFESALAEAGPEGGPPASPAVHLRVDPRGLIISLAEAAFFDSGSAAVRPASYPALDRVMRTLPQVPNYIRIEGHTDNQPIRTAQFPSNWELSTARATFIANYLIKKYDYSPQKLAVAGYAEYRPVAGNGTADGRALNRRVDIVVLNDKATRREEPQGRRPAAAPGVPGPARPAAVVK